MFDDDTTFEQWQDIGVKLGQLGKGLQWAMGDWLAFGEGKPEWGDKYEGAIEVLGVKYSMCASMKWVARTYQFSNRLENLAWTHHLIVAALDPPDRKRFLKQAEAKGWSVGELRKQVRIWKLAKLLADRNAPAADRCGPQGSRRQADRRRRESAPGGEAAGGE